MSARRLLAVALTCAAALLLTTTAHAAAPRTSLSDIEDEVMCVTCGTALNISEAPSADRERDYIKRLVAQGLTKQQVKDELVRQYGRNVLATPANPLAWIIPVLIALLATLAIGFTVARWRRGTRASHARAEDDEPAPRAPDLDPADAARLDRDMAAFDR